MKTLSSGESLSLNTFEAIFYVFLLFLIQQTLRYELCVPVTELVPVKLSVCCEQADWWQVVVPLLTEYRRLLALVFSLTDSFTASYTDVGAGHCSCDCEYR